MIGLAITAAFTLAALVGTYVLTDSYIKGRNAYRKLIERIQP